MTNREQLLYALKVQRLHEVLVLKDDIHLQYKYKNINRATNQASTFQDKIIDAVIEDAVTGTNDPISSSTIKNNVEKIIDTNLRNDTKRISYGIPDKAVNAAVSNISNRYQFILGNRIREEIPNLQGKIEDYINSKNLGNLSEADLRETLKDQYGEHAQKRIQNIIRDSFHTNECNLSWVKAVYDGYQYKTWNNGRTKRTRVWHKAKFIESVPIDETFDIYGSYPARMMYPGDLNGGAENVANCKCWLSYSNRLPSDLRGTGKKTTTKSSKSSKSKKNGLISKVKNTIKKPLNNIKSKIKNNPSLKFNDSKNSSKQKSSKFEFKIPTYYELTDIVLSELNESYKIFPHIRWMYEKLNPKICKIGDNKKLFYKGLTIVKKGWVDYLSFNVVKMKVDLLPKILVENITEIRLNWGYSPEGTDIACVYHDAKTIIEVYFGGSSSGEYIDAIVHEATHVLDHNYNGKLYGISNQKGKWDWEESIIKDKEHMFKHNIPIENDGFVSEYAKSNYEIAIDKSDREKMYEGRFAEDLAEAVPLYLKNKSEFLKKYPNRAKILHELLEV